MSERVHSARTADQTGTACNHRMHGLSLFFDLIIRRRFSFRGEVSEVAVEQIGQLSAMRLRPIGQLGRLSFGWPDRFSTSPPGTRVRAGSVCCTHRPRRAPAPGRAVCVAVARPGAEIALPSPIHRHSRFRCWEDPPTDAYRPPGSVVLACSYAAEGADPNPHRLIESLSGRAP